MLEPAEVEVPARAVARLGRHVGAARLSALQQAATDARAVLGGAVVWNVSSTAHGGGVAEMLQFLVGYAKGLGVDARWAVIEGDAAFFGITKRLHNRLHGVPGDEGALGREEGEHYRAVLERNAAGLARHLRGGDVVLLHDPQTAGMAGALAARGARVVWRCHIGSDQANACSEEAWSFLRPHLAACHAFVFSHAAFVPPLLANQRVEIIEPAIDPLAPKNQPLRRTRYMSLLARAGLLPGERDGGGAVVGDAPPFGADERLVVQVSRWDRLKDMAGVMRGFAEHVAGPTDARHALVGPAVASVSDDPEGARVLAECTDAWASLSPRVRDTIRLVMLPMDDVELNALTVNAVQRHASVVVQKSLQEGFGLTVTEAMWKERPVVASAVGGIVDQVPSGTGLLLPDPTDLGAFGEVLSSLLSRPSEMSRLGRRARRHVRAHFLCDRQLADHARLLKKLASA